MNGRIMSGRAIRLGLVALMAMANVSCEAQGDFELHRFPTSDGGEIEGALFRAEGQVAAVLAHGAVFNKESWYELSEKLRDAGVSALPIDFRGYGKSKADDKALKHLDVLGAIAYLEKEGFTRIAVIGASMGGAATLKALAESSSAAVDKAVLLAPAGGPPIASDSIDKLFIVSRFDQATGSRPTQKLHDESADPKAIHIYEGSAHAQHLFKSEHADDLTKRILDFVSD